MTKEEMLTNLENNQYVSGGSFGLNAAYFLLGNPLTDSAVVNAFAKTNSAAFELSLRSGGNVAYNNYTVAGGNFLYNSLSKFKPFKNLKTGTISIGKKFNLNFISSKELETSAGAGVKQVSESTGLNLKSDIVRTGWGVGRNYNEFFSNLSKTGFNIEDLSQYYNKYGMSKPTNSYVAKSIKEMSDSDFLKLSKYISKEDMNKFNNIRNTSKKYVDNSIKKSFKKFMFNEKSVGVTEWNASNLSSKILEHFNNISTEQTKKIIDSFISTGGKIKDYSGTVTKEIMEEAAESIGKKFAERTTFEKIISSKFMRIATGAAISLPNSIALPLTIGTTALGMAATAGQDNAVNNFINSNLYNTNDYDNYLSDEAISSIVSASNIRDMNLQALYNAYSNVNVAERYLNDMDSISFDNNFTLEDVEVM